MAPIDDAGAVAAGGSVEGPALMAGPKTPPAAGGFAIGAKFGLAVNPDRLIEHGGAVGLQPIYNKSMPWLLRPGQRILSY